MDEFFSKADYIIGRTTLIIISIIGAYKWIRHEWTRRHD
jgi:hypothetical protein